MGSEGGEPLSSIVARKEVERQQTGGIFFWGIGNPLGRAPEYVAALQTNVPVIFSRMLSPAKRIDEEPSVVLVWRKYKDAMGNLRRLPDGVRVTSRGVTASGTTKDRHYALVCRSDRPLTLANYGRFDPSAYRNATAGGAIGHSQVTCILQKVGVEAPDAPYEISLLAELAAPYFVQLADPVPLAPSYDEAGSGELLLSKTA